MSQSEITQSLGREIVYSQVLELDDSGVNFTNPVKIDTYNTHSYLFTLQDKGSYSLNPGSGNTPTPDTPVPLSASVFVQVSNNINDGWADIFQADISSSHLETFHFKEIFNFKYTRIKIIGSGFLTI